MELFQFQCLYQGIKSCVIVNSQVMLFLYFSQVVHQTETLEIEIIGEASKVHRHTSAMLDVKTRANEIEFFNIIVDESPIIPYEIYRRYVAGSPSGSMTITGDTVGENCSLYKKSFLDSSELSWRLYCKL